MKYRTSGLIIVVLWILISIALTYWSIKKITPQDIFLGEYSCSYSTIAECAKKLITPRAVQEIKDNLNQIFRELERINIIFQLPLKVLQFNLRITERGSEIQKQISQPKLERTLLSGLDLVCSFDDKFFPVNSDKKSDVIKIIRLSDLEGENVIEKKSNDIMGGFSGCQWSPQNNFELQDLTKDKVAPFGKVSVVTKLKPYLVFEADLGGIFFIFVAWFVIIGGFFALIKEIFQLLQKGLSYFIEENKFMTKNIQELHKLIIDVGRGGDATKLNIGEISDYHQLATDLLRHPLPVGKENRCDFLKGLVLLENELNLGSTSPFHNFMKRLDLYKNAELMDWIFANRNNPYIPFGSFRPPFEVRSYSQHLEYDKKHQEHRGEMIDLDMERSRLAKERKEKIREEHAARKKVNDEKRKHKDKNVN